MDVEWRRRRDEEEEEGETREHFKEDCHSQSVPPGSMSPKEGRRVVAGTDGATAGESGTASGGTDTESFISTGRGDFLRPRENDGGGTRRRRRRRT